MVKILYADKPVVIACIICAFVFYFPKTKIPLQKPYKSLVKKENLVSVQGKILSSPVRLSNGKFYATKISLTSAKDKNGIQSSAYGIIDLYIPSQMAEAFLPGKLYSSAYKNGAYLYEYGESFVFGGFFKKNVFIAENAASLGFEKNLTGHLAQIRAYSRLYFKKLMYSWGKAGGLLAALLSGSKEYTEKSIADAFRNAGLSHILALSGMHLSLFSGIAMFFGKRTHRKKIAFLIRTVSLLLFVWFAGFSPSLKRAFICAMLTIFYKLSASEEPDMFLILCFSFLFQSMLFPDEIQNTAFILSYSALAGILLLSPYIKKFLCSIMPSFPAASFASSIGACLFTMPVNFSFFGSFAPIGIIATFFVSPVITLFIYSGLVLIILSLFFPILSYPSGIFVNFEYNFIKSLVMIFSRFPVWSISN